MARSKKVLHASRAAVLVWLFMVAGCSGAPSTSFPASLPSDQEDRIGSLLRAGDAERAAGNFETAAMRYKEAIAISPRSLDAWLALGDAELAQQHNDAAADAYRSAQAIDDGNAGAAFWLGQIALRAGNAPVAVDEFEHGLKSHKDDPRLNNGAAVAYSIEGKYELARQHYETALAREPNNSSLQSNYGLLLLQTGDLDGALAAFASLTQSYPANNRYRINLALAYLALGRKSDALANAPSLTEDQLRRVLAVFYHGKSAPALASSSNTLPIPILAHSAGNMSPPNPLEKAADEPEAPAPIVTAAASSAPDSATPPLSDINPTAGRGTSSPSTSPPQVVPATGPNSASGAHKIQVGSVRSELGAQQEWQRLLEHQRDVLGDLSLVISRADLGMRGVFYRIEAGPIPNATEADRRCNELHNRKLGCIVLRQ